MTIKKTNLKYFLLPLVSALFVVSCVTVILFSFFNKNEVLINDMLSNNIEDFNSMKFINSISIPMDESGSYWYAPSESFKVEDGYIFSMRMSETETIVTDETAGTTEEVEHKFTIIMKTDFEGNEIWSYEFESTDTGWRHDILVYNNVVYVAGNYYGMFTLNASDGSLLNSYPDYYCYDLSIEGQYIAGISDSEFYLFNSNLEIVNSIDVNDIESDTYDVWFYNYYYDGNNYYILGEHDVEDVYTPYIFTFDSNLSLISELAITYDENQGYLSEDGRYYSYDNFFKSGDKFYQIGEDVHEIDAVTGINTRLLDSSYSKFKNDYYDAYEEITDILIVGDKILSLDTIFGYNTVGRTYISINDSSFNFEDSIQVNDGYSADSSYGEQISLIENGVLVKWYDFYTEMIYISEFEFVYEPVCTVVSGVGTEFGDKIQCGTESFYVTEYDGENVTMLAEYNLLAGWDYTVLHLSEPIISKTYNDYANYLNIEEVWDTVEKGYYIGYPLSSYSAGTYTITGVSFNRDASPGYEYAGLKFDSSVAMTASDFYQQEEVKEKLLDGYFIGKVYSSNFLCDTSTTICTDNYYGMVFYKQSNYVAHTIYFDDLVLKNDISTYLDSNSEYQEYYNNGYRIDDYFEEKKYDGTTYTYYYSGLVMYKFTGDYNDANYYGPFIQDETAIGAHGTEEGKPDPNEIGIFYYNNSLYYGGVDVIGAGNDFYETGFVDFELLYYGEPLYYLAYYKNYLSRMGIKTSNITIPTVTDINNWAYDVTGTSIPLEEWYTNAVSEYNQNHNVNFMVLGPVKDYFVDYPWLYQTTYYLRTASPDYTTYFIDTLGYLCSANTCAVSVGAGVRPLVTMSVENIAFNITTTTDGNGEVVASQDTATSGDTITFTVTPYDEYVLNSITVTDDNGNVVTFTDYTFTMPAADVVIDAKFDKKVYFEPQIEINPSNVTNAVIGETIYYQIVISNSYSFDFTDVIVGVDTLGAECINTNCTKIDDYTFKFSSIKANSQDKLSLVYIPLEFGYSNINAEIFEAYAESPNFLNEEKDYIATAVATTKAGLEVCNVLDGTGNGSVNQYHLKGYYNGYYVFDYWIVLNDNSCTKISLDTDITYQLTQLDKKEYTLESVTGLINGNGVSFTLEPKTYKITFNNSYEKKGYFHSWDRKENDIEIFILR